MKFIAQITGDKAFIRTLANVKKDLPKIIDDELNSAALDMQRIAKRLAPVDEGYLRNSIGVDVSRAYEKEFFANAYYAAYREFGTGRKAKIPARYSSLAAAFKGNSGRGNATQFFYRLVQWVRRKGISGTYSIRTQRRTGNLSTQAQQDYAAAYVIMLSILKNGSRPTPFMIPAFEQVEKEISKSILSKIKSKRR